MTKKVSFYNKVFIKEYFLSDEERYDKQMCWFNITQRVKTSYLTEWYDCGMICYYEEDPEEVRPPLYHFIGTTIFLIGSIAYYFYISN